MCIVNADQVVHSQQIVMCLLSVWSVKESNHLQVTITDNIFVTGLIQQF